jgi:hypothetical protein
MGNRQHTVQKSDVVQWVKSHAMTKKKKNWKFGPTKKKSAVSACCYGFAKLPLMTNSFSDPKCTVTELLPHVPFSVP